MVQHHQDHLFLQMMEVCIVNTFNYIQIPLVLNFLFLLFIIKTITMGFNFYSLLKDNDKLKDMPKVQIDKRTSDKSVTYNKQKNRLDNIAGNVYSDETYWRLILWANENYFMEFDIPDNAVIRVPYPLQDVLNEVQTKIVSDRDRG